MASIVFLHGLESGPMGNKARYLATAFGAVTPALDTSAAVELAASCARRGETWGHASFGVTEALAKPYAQAVAAIEKDTQLVIGSSFGGAMLQKLLLDGVWSGPSLFIAGAGPKLWGRADFPANTQAILLHGRNDDVVPLADSRVLAASGGPGVMLWETGGDHRMNDILSSGLLATAIRFLLPSA